MPTSDVPKIRHIDCYTRHPHGKKYRADIRATDRGTGDNSRVLWVLWDDVIPLVGTMDVVQNNDGRYGNRWRILENK